MSTTSSTLASVQALAAGQHRHGNGRKGRGVLAIAVVMLGLSLVVGGMFIQGRQAAETQGAGLAASSSHVATMWDYREDRRVGASAEFAADPFAYREDRREP